MAVVGDTQYVSVNNPENFHYIYDYILENVDKKNIKFVIGLGDITDSDSDTEWALDTEEIKRMMMLFIILLSEETTIQKIGSIVMFHMMEVRPISQAHMKMEAS